MLFLAGHSARLRGRIHRLLGALTAMVLLPPALFSQLTTGIIEGTLRDNAGRSLSSVHILITGALGFQTTISTLADGKFMVVLPYGEYRLQLNAGRHPNSAAASVSVVPLESTRVDFVINRSGLRIAKQAPTSAAGLWNDNPRRLLYPEAFSLQGVLLSREPSSITEPADLTGTSDNRLAFESQRAYSWTDTLYKLQGVDATDSYQPGRPMTLPDIQALNQIVVRSAFEQTDSSSNGTEVGVFLANPGTHWHGTLASAGTGSFLASTNLPRPIDRGLVQQADQFRWMTRDDLQLGGPITKWADIFASGTGQWASQTVPLARPRSSQDSRLLFGNVHGRIEASSRDLIDADYSGSRINLSDGGIPAGIEALTGNRMAPSFVLPGGFPTQSEVDHLDFLQTGWTHSFPAVSTLGTIEFRYAYSSAHLDTRPSTSNDGPPQSRIELLGGSVTGLPPLDNLAVRTRHDLEGTWQPAMIQIGATRHRIRLGGGWKTSSPRNRFTTPSGMNLITANGVPAFVTEFNTPLNERERINSFAGFVGDHLNLTNSLSLDVGGLADFSRGSLPAQSSPAGAFTPARLFPAQPDLIVWNNVSPRAGFAWNVPRLHRLILQGAYFRLYEPLAGRYLDFGNPDSLGGSEYQWIDRNGDGWFQPGEQGALLLRFGGPYSSIARSLHRPYSDSFEAGAKFLLAAHSFAGIHLFRRDDKERIAAIDTGVPAQAFSPRSILDPGPDGITGTFDDQQLTVYQQNPATFGQDQYLLTNPPGLRMLNTGMIAEVGTEWRNVMIHASFVAEKSYGPTNPGDAVFENDPGVIGSLFLDPNTAIHAAGRSFVDRGYVGKIQAIWRMWGGIEVASVANYMDGLVFARQLLVSGLAQGPFLVATTVRGSPEGGNRAQYILNWNLRLAREFKLRVGHLSAAADVLNVTNAAQRIQENDLTGPSFNSRLPVAIQAPRLIRLQLRYEF
jgi:hypothetical protein